MVEIYNRTGSPINFGATPYVFDDFVGKLTEGTSNRGRWRQASRHLVQRRKITPETWPTMWGAGKNYIARRGWPALNNAGGDTIAIWDGMGDYDNEQIDGDDHRAHALARRRSSTTPWPDTAGDDQQRQHRSISIICGQPNDGANWTRVGH